jgi:hypothetical protein
VATLIAAASAANSPAFIEADMIRRALFVMIVMACAAGAASAQENVPILSGGMGVLGESDGGSPSAQPVIAPVLTIPIGSKWLIESRADIRGFVSRSDGNTGPLEGTSSTTLEYAQVDYNAASWLTVTAGRILTPFGIYNERISAIWINKFESAPLIYPIGTARGYLDGIMTRGSVFSTPNYSINYIAYASTLSTVSNLESQRTAGSRIGVFFPKLRLEIGSSYQKLLQGNRTNSQGVDISWEPGRVPLDFKAEWAHSPSGQGYWFQTAYRLSQFKGPDSFVGRFEPVFRMQQFLRGQAVSGDELPANGAQEADFGLNFYAPHSVRLHASYGRQFTPTLNLNVWEFGITYRFLFPMWPAGGVK